MKRFLPVILAALIGALVAAPVSAITTTLNITGFIAAGAGTAATCVLLGTATHTTCNNVNNGSAVQFANADGASFSSFLGSNSGVSLNAVPCADFRAGKWDGVTATSDLCVDSSGNASFRGFAVDGNGPLDPCAGSTNAGAACATGVKTTYFIVTLSSCTANSACPSAGTVSNFPFASSSTWGCNVSEIGSNFSGSGTGTVEVVVVPSSGSAGNIEEFNGSTSTYAAKVFGSCKGT